MRAWLALCCGLALLTQASLAQDDPKKEKEKEKGKDQPSPTKDLVPGLLAALRDPDPEVRQYAQSALGNLGAEAVPVLIQALETGDDDLRILAAKSLANLGATGQRLPETIPPLLKLLKDKNLSVRRAAAYALSQIVTPSEPAEKLPEVPPKP